jgi:hypothetical protein
MSVSRFELRASQPIRTSGLVLSLGPCVLMGITERFYIKFSIHVLHKHLRTFLHIIFVCILLCH